MSCSRLASVRCRLRYSMQHSAHVTWCSCTLATLQASSWRPGTRTGTGTQPAPRRSHAATGCVNCNQRAPSIVHLGLLGWLAVTKGLRLPLATCCWLVRLGFVSRLVRSMRTGVIVGDCRLAAGPDLGLAAGLVGRTAGGLAGHALACGVGRSRAGRRLADWLGLRWCLQCGHAHAMSSGVF